MMSLKVMETLCPQMGRILLHAYLKFLRIASIFVFWLDTNQESEGQGQGSLGNQEKTK